MGSLKTLREVAVRLLLALLLMMEKALSWSDELKVEFEAQS
jgi:hypothetical protein